MSAISGRGLVVGISVFALAFAAALYQAQHSPSVAPPPLTEVQIPSSADGSKQPARLMIPTPASNRAMPLVVWLHTWSGNYRQNSNVPAAVRECRERNWIFIEPDFRGPNDHPEACGSDLALRDLLDAVDYVAVHARVDMSRVYLLGTSGGGYLTLLAAGRYPGRWSAASAWVPISDMAAWYDDAKRLKTTYWKSMEGCFGGPPSPSTAAEYLRRSPVAHLSGAAGIPLHISAGIHDGHRGSVPIRHSLRAFNLLAAASGRADLQFTPEQIEFMTEQERIDPALVPTSAPASAPASDMTVLLHRRAGAAEITLFEGAHEIRVRSAFEWLARQSRATTRPSS